MNKRLFLFAGYDPRGHVDAALIHYCRALGELGDVVVCMDCDAPRGETDKIAPYCRHIMAARHGEYDFGSYRRAYTWAAKNLNLAQYDIVYMVNDSVYGPLFDLKPVLTRIEEKNYDAFGLVCNPHPRTPHIQSWFIGCRKSVFLSRWFDEFMHSITRQPDKGTLISLYEHGFTRHVIAHNLTWGCLISVHHHGVYGAPKKLFRAGLPFVKKAAFFRHNCAHGAQVSYILSHCDDAARRAILNAARDALGDAHLRRLLTRNPIKIAYRSLTYGLHKILTGAL